MSKSDTLRLRDVRAACRLIGDCRDLGSEPALWHQRMLDGLLLLFGVVQAVSGEAWWPRPGGSVQPVAAYSASADPAAEDAYRAYHRDGEAGADPILLAIGQRPARMVTYTRPQLVPDAEWQRSVSFDQYRRPAGLDHSLISILQLSAEGATNVVALNRTLGERDFSPREQQLLRFFHAELGRLIGGPLVASTDPDIKGLSPRLGQTLACLIEGDSEKQVAARLGLSLATVHQYVTALYRRFAVHSRAQLLACVMRRLPRQNGTGST